MPVLEHPDQTGTLDDVEPPRLARSHGGRDRRVELGDLDEPRVGGARRSRRHERDDRDREKRPSSAHAAQARIQARAMALTAAP